MAAAHEEGLDQDQLAQQLLAQAKEQGVELVGPDGLLNQLTKPVLETALEEEMSEHLGYDKHDPVGRNRGNSRKGVRGKTVLTEIGPVEIEVPRDTDASFDPQIVKKRQRRLGQGLASSQPGRRCCRSTRRRIGVGEGIGSAPQTDVRAPSAYWGAAQRLGLTGPTIPQSEPIFLVIEIQLLTVTRGQPPRMVLVFHDDALRFVEPGSRRCLRRGGSVAAARFWLLANGQHDDEASEGR